MNKMWALVANSSYAQVFEITGKGKHINLVRRIDNPQGRQQNRDINSDKQGRTFDKFGKGRHHLSEDVSAKTHENQIFAHNIAQILKGAFDQQSFDELAIIAPPEFMGHLNQAISPPVKQKISKEVTKNLPEAFSEQKVIDMLCEYLDLWNR